MFIKILETVKKILNKLENTRSLREIPRLVELYRFLQIYLPDQGHHGFHSDRIFQSLIEEIISCLPITSFVETGTYLGDSTVYVASRWSNLSIFTCEVNSDFFNKSKRRLKKFRNVEISQTSSPEYLKELLKNNRLGELPLFFLDAHWYDYWPLEDEINLISLFCPNAIIIIDDFEVPSRPDFRYDVSCGGSKEFGSKIVVDQVGCNLDLIYPKLSQKNVYCALFPRYSKDDAFPNKKSGAFRGHIVLFQNAGNYFEILKHRKIILKNYKFFNLIKK